MGCCGSSLAGEDGSSSFDHALSPAKTPDGKNPQRLSQARRNSEVYMSPEIDSLKPVYTEFDPAVIGSMTRHGIAPARGANGVASKAKINQDRGLVCWPFNGTYNNAIICVFDGHGVNGERISEWCATEVCKRLEQKSQLLSRDPMGCLSETIIEMDKHLLSHSVLGRVARGAGTTSNVLYFTGSKLFVACSGDSRAVMGRAGAGDSVVAVELSQDHKPDLPQEKKRIEAAGGVVSNAGPRGLPPSRVWVNGRVGLAMSRSIGDGEAKDHGVVPDPEIKLYELRPSSPGKNNGDRFVIVASDGIWEFITSQQACDIVKDHDNASEAARVLVDTAADRWREEEGSYRDDITCIVAFLPFLENRTVDGEGVEGGVTDRQVDIELDINAEDQNAVPLSPETGFSWLGKSQSQLRDEGKKFAERRLSVGYDDPHQDVDA